MRVVLWLLSLQGSGLVMLQHKLSSAADDELPCLLA
jgi:hypothetical protein